MLIYVFIYLSVIYPCIHVYICIYAGVSSVFHVASVIDVAPFPGSPFPYIILPPLL